MKRDEELRVYHKNAEDYWLEVWNKVLALRALKATKFKAVTKDLC